MKLFTIICVCVVNLVTAANAQIKDTAAVFPVDTLAVKATGQYPLQLAYRDKHPLNAISLSIPAAGIGYGILALHKGPLKTLDLSTKHEILEDHPRYHTHLDDYLQYSPAVAVFGLNAVGIRGEHSFVDELVIYGVSSVVMFGMVEGLKRTTHEQRPDGSAFNSFPSGHTATAFAAAEWLREEYWDRSPWIGIAGYTAATATGVIRIYNNRHWVSDVVGAAAIGFLSTRIAYAVNPWVEKHIFHQGRKAATLTGITRLEWNYPTIQADSGNMKEEKFTTKVK